MELLDLESVRAQVQPFNKRPVIYFLFRDSELVYIGRTTNYFLRIGTHATGIARKDFDSYAAVDVPDGVDPEQMELSYILKLRPSRNRAGYHPSTWTETTSVAAQRVVQSLDAGMSVKEVAKQEGISVKRVESIAHDRRKRQNETDELLLSSANAESVKAGV